MTDFFKGTGPTEAAGQDNGAHNSDPDPFRVLEALNTENEALKAENAALRDKALRALADFENLRRRFERQYRRDRGAQYVQCKSVASVACHAMLPLNASDLWVLAGLALITWLACVDETNVDRRKVAISAPDR